MRRHSFRFRQMIIILLVLTVGFPAIQPQSASLAGEDENSIVIVGSGYMQTLLQEMIDDYQANETSAAEFSLRPGGTALGITDLCNGDAAASMATQFITDAQALNCQDNDVDFIEFLLAIDHAVLVVDEDSEVSCVDESTFRRVFSRTGALTLDVIFEGGSEEEVVTVYGTDDSGTAYTFVRANYLDDRSPVIDEVFENPTDIRDTLAESGNNGVALMTLDQWSSIDQEGLKLVDLRPVDGTDCITPTAGTLSTGEYPASRFLMLYAAASAVNDTELGLMLRYQFGNEEMRPIDSAASTTGFQSPVTNIIDRNRNNLNDLVVGRSYSRTENPQIVNNATEGTIQVAGNFNSSALTNTLFTTFNQSYQAIEINKVTYGDAAAWEAFCNGEVNVIQVGLNSPMPSDCDVATIEVPLGANAVVFVVARQGPLPTCLDYNQVAQMLLRQDLTVSVNNPNAEEDAQLLEDTESDTEGDPAEAPTAAPTEVFEEMATESPTEEAASAPLQAPTELATETIEEMPTAVPTEEATEVPTENATEVPSEAATETPSEDASTEGDETATEEPEIELDPDFDDPQGPLLWSEIVPELAESNPELPMVILVPEVGNPSSDFVLSTVQNDPALRRTDKPTIREADSNTGLDALDYRFFSLTAAEGTITYVTWAEYQQAPNADALRLVEIADPDGNCIPPTVESIADGSYPLTYSARLVFAESAVSDPAIANLMWFTYNRDALQAIEDLNLVGFDRISIETNRDSIFALLENATLSDDGTGETEISPATPTEAATQLPTEVPTEISTEVPSTEVEENATESATEVPTAMPTETSTEEPSEAPTALPTEASTEPTE